MQLAGRFDALLDALFPRVCLLCGGPSEGLHPHCCSTCLESFHPIDSGCIKCGRPFAVSSIPHLCLDCLTRRPPFTWNRALYLYSGQLTRALGLLKYQRRLALLPPLTAALKEGVERLSLPPLDLAVPVPISLGGFARRGFNLSEVFAGHLAERLNLALETGALRNRGGAHQAGLGKVERRRNAARLFTAGRAIRKVAGRRVLLVDDVYTTGATVRACARLLRKSGADVSVLTLARVPPVQNLDHLVVKESVARQGP